MPPALAFAVSTVLVILLFRYDPARDRSTSPALWLPLIWMFFAGCRLPAQWLGLTPISVATAFEEGSAFDRIFFLSLIAGGLWILSKRHLRWPAVFASNSALTAFLLFALASVIWSDYPFVSLKRWIRDLGMYLMVLVVLTDRRPLEAISILLRRLSFLLVCLSVVLIKYYRHIAVSYNPWTGAPEFIGATTSKNMLGAVCLISGLVFFWDTAEHWRQRRLPRIRRRLLINAVLIAMTLWLLNLSQSATSKVCLVIGCLIITIVRTKWVKANLRRLTGAIVATLAAYVVLEFGFDFSSTVAPLIGRDPTLTGRTEIWSMVLALQGNPMFGVGYQAFWLGDRLTAIISRTRFLNESHNGYLETYLNLGFVGVVLIAFIIVFSYRTIRRRLALSAHLGSFSLALWVVMLFYNMTEAAFGASLLWWVFLLCTIVVPRPDALMLHAEKASAETRAVALRRARGYLPHQAAPSGVRGTHC
jgi:exopolysaccharide production protein ExoQ